MPRSEPKPDPVRISSAGIMGHGIVASFSVRSALSISRQRDDRVTTWLAVIAGGALGTAVRHGVNVWFARHLAYPTPYPTAAVNLIGAGIIGILAGAIAAGRLHMSGPLRSFVFVGILGGFTTFSSYMLDTLTLAYGGEP